jgi:hypothetical protein
MHHLIGALVAGAIAGAATRSSIGVRSGVRRIVKGGIVAKRKVQALGTSAVDEARKVMDEARAELDHTGAEHSN